jgi:hypothetical protein
MDGDGASIQRWKGGCMDPKGPAGYVHTRPPTGADFAEAASNVTSSSARWDTHADTGALFGSASDLKRSAHPRGTLAHRL